MTAPIEAAMEAARDFVAKARAAIRGTHGARERTELDLLAAALASSGARSPRRWVVVRHFDLQLVDPDEPFGARSWTFRRLEVTPAAVSFRGGEAVTDGLAASGEHEVFAFAVGSGLPDAGAEDLARWLAPKPGADDFVAVRSTPAP